MSASTTSAGFFEKKYVEDPDPWNFTQSSYEQARYAATISALGERRYKCAFEPGCSIGELTWRLAERCDHVVAIDLSSTAIAAAQARCRGLSNVSFRVGSVGSPPRLVSNRNFDLIVFSEIGYYFDEAGLQKLGKWMINRLCVSGTLLAVHWLGTSPDHLQSGDCVHEILEGLNGLRLEQSIRHEHYRLDRWVRT